LRNEIDLGLTALPVESKELDAVLAPGYVAGPASPTESRLAASGGVDVRPTMEFDGIDAIKSAVAAGPGMAIVPGPAMTQGPPVNNVVVRRLNPPLVRTLGLVEKPGRAEPPALRIVRDAIMTLRSADG
jgi:DNA-binding transcriptional LysR family regulator